MNHLNEKNKDFLHHTDGSIVTELPNSLKTLVRLVARGFYTTEDVLIIDMLVRNPCMKEDDIAELLHFEKKQLRARISMLRNDKFIQIRLRMETGVDGKAQKVNYYFINYKTFVNVIKYKLDIMRKRMLTEERDITNRSSFKCTNCTKTFTDLEADQLYNIITQEFRCTYCNNIVEEDDSAVPKKDTRLMLARFNEQLEPLYNLLREIESIKLTPELLEPEPIDINIIRGLMKPNIRNGDNPLWSGEATRNQGLAADTASVNISICSDLEEIEPIETKQGPIWMTESTVMTDVYGLDPSEMANSAPSPSSATTSNLANNTNFLSNFRRREHEDVMSMLLQCEAISQVEYNMQTQNALPDSSGSEDSMQDGPIISISDDMDYSQPSSEEDDVIKAPTISISGKSYKLCKIRKHLVSKMTQQEKAHYINIYRQLYNDAYD